MASSYFRTGFAKANDGSPTERHVQTRRGEVLPDFKIGRYALWAYAGDRNLNFRTPCAMSNRRHRERDLSTEERRADFRFLKICRGAFAKYGGGRNLNLRTPTVRRTKHGNQEWLLAIAERGSEIPTRCPMAERDMFRRGDVIPVYNNRPKTQFRTYAGARNLNLRTSLYDGQIRDCKHGVYLVQNGVRHGQREDPDGETCPDEKRGGSPGKSGGSRMESIYISERCAEMPAMGS